MTMQIETSLTHYQPTLWTEEEDTFLRGYYGKWSATKIGRILGRTRNMVIGRANRLKLCKPHRRPRRWSPADDLTLLTRYGTDGWSAAELASLLGRTEAAIRVRAQSRGLCRPMSEQGKANLAAAKLIRDSLDRGDGVN